MTTLEPAPVFDHLLRMTDQNGTFEHACFGEPRTEHGYCTDDMARVLVVASREPHANDNLHDLAALTLRYLDGALADDGCCHNRMDRTGRWLDEPSVSDWWGRCIWGLGTAAAHSDVPAHRQAATAQFERAVQQRSPWPRAMSYAVLGAAELVSADCAHREARSLLVDYANTVAKPNGNPAWPWPEERLTYANAVLPEAMIAAGTALEDTALCRHGLDLLSWLVAVEINGDHLSPTPVGGRGPGETGPAFDQQPIEVSALAEACARAAAVDPSPLWPACVRMAAAWFTGSNDAGQVMWDQRTGAGFDGLRVDGVNENQGAESTLAVLATLQQAKRFPEPGR